MSSITGIDLGTTFSALALVDETGKPSLVSIDNERIMASCVYFPESEPGKMIVGQQAKNALSIEPHSVLQRFKRDMGTDRSFQLRPGLSSTPVEASAKILQKLVQEASKGGHQIHEVVITVPANFGEDQRRATIEAGRKAGLKVRNIINEPTAAVLAYAVQRPVNGTVLVYDLGGGTFDVTIAKVEGQDVECLTSEGDSGLGGIDFDECIAGLIDGIHQEVHGRSLKEALGIAQPDEIAASVEWQSLLKDAEEIKKTLSVRESAPFRYLESPDGRLIGEITRSDFEKAISSMIARTEMLVETALDNIEISPSGISEVLLVGGSTRIPAIRDSLTRLFGSPPTEGVNPDEAVALGASIFSGFRSDRSELNPVQRETLGKVKVTDVANHFYGTISVRDDADRGVRDEDVVSIVIPKDTPLPCSITKRFATTVPGQLFIRCRVVQSNQEETDPQFVNLVYDQQMGPFPPGRPAQCPIDITYNYNLDATMDVEFLDVQSGQRHRAQLNLDSQQDSPAVDPNEFVIE
jgi:molecular chaperone DnaK